LQMMQTIKRSMSRQTNPMYHTIPNYHRVPRLNPQRLRNRTVGTDTIDKVETVLIPAIIAVEREAWIFHLPQLFSFYQTCRSMQMSAI